MQIKTKTEVTLTLSAEEVVDLCAGLGALLQRGKNPFTGTPLTTTDKSRIAAARADLAESIPYDEESGADPDSM